MLSANERINVLSEYGRDLNVFVETGTADGYTTISLINEFDLLVTIELDFDRYLHVTTSLFMGKPKILPLYGDSGLILEKVVYNLSQPALYWLDAHYSGGVRGPKDTPIMDELFAIGKYARPGTTVLIDDARLFGEDPSYPRMHRIRRWASTCNYRMDVDEDIIRLVTKE